MTDAGFQITSDIPVPVRHPQSKYNLGKTLDALEIGQSFFVPGETSSTVNGWFVARRPKKFSTRTLTEGGVRGVRIWRIA